MSQVNLAEITDEELNVLEAEVTNEILRRQSAKMQKTASYQRKTALQAPRALEIKAKVAELQHFYESLPTEISTDLLVTLRVRLAVDSEIDSIAEAIDSGDNLEEMVYCNVHLEVVEDDYWERIPADLQREIEEFIAYPLLDGFEFYDQSWTDARWMAFRDRMQSLSEDCEVLKPYDLTLLDLMNPEE